ncbi:MAG TPA: tripartite tricarboxylate transporter substrate binding protein [Xanthobacteraceae bacterium]|nr:tripartite tricarboxylate transporter substrate binding protein [Xanthobacteraceae bacterium]
MKRTIFGTVLAMLLALTGFASAETFPDRTLTMIIPFAAGGPTDVLGRVMAQRIGELLGQTVIVENIGGAGGMTGSKRVADARPDGYTMLLGTVGTQAQGQTLYKHPLYNSVTDFTPIALVADVPIVLIVRKDLPVNSLKELIDYVKQNDGKVIYGSQGVGATTHLTANMFMTMTGTHMVHVPYRGETLVLNDLLGGHVDLFFGNISAGLALYRAGKVKVLAVADTARNDAIPDVPTTGEAGLPGLVAVGWFAMAGPPGLKPELRDKIAADANEAIALADVQTKMRAVGVTPMGGSPAKMAAFIKEETERWGEVIRKNNIVME